LTTSEPLAVPATDSVRITRVDPALAWSTPSDVKSVAIVGLGYVGLPTALAFADNKIDVIGVDINQERLQDIRNGRADLIPADIARLDRVLADDAISLTDDISAMTAADAVIVCVPTPVDRHLTPDLRALRAACAAVVQHARAGQLLVLTSTSYIGTTEDLLVAPLKARGLKVGTDVHVAFSPERIDPGNVTMTQEKVPRVVGGVTLDCTERAGKVISLVAPVVHLVSSPKVAEFAKLFENTYRAVNIALANEMADVARKLDLDIMEVITAAETKPYGFSAFYPGPGIGGHCIPCDPHYLLWHLRAERGEAPLVETAMARSAARPGQVVTRAGEALADNGKAISGARVLVVGVTYKPDVQDVRESPALEIIEGLVNRGAQVGFHDPMVNELELENGHVLKAVSADNLEEWDLAIVHTLHTGVDLGWLATLPTVLDATYRLRTLANRVAL
jgi:UDP-N-acetyl-D-glucosamine dehydrogenase